MQELVVKLENKFKDINSKIDVMIKKAIANPIGLLSEYDIIQNLGIEQDEYDFLKEFSKYNLEIDEMNMMRQLSAIYNRKIRMIDIANEKIILSNPKLVNKNTMSYLLSKSNQDMETNNVTINVNVDDRFKKLDLKTLGVIKDDK